ncbi:hypothetical protein MJO28_004099, partial [Puccinia striiformis f. sp. tritici]
FLPKKKDQSTACIRPKKNPSTEIYVLAAKQRSESEHRHFGLSNETTASNPSTQPSLSRYHDPPECITLFKFAGLKVDFLFVSTKKIDSF